VELANVEAPAGVIACGAASSVRASEDFFTGVSWHGCDACSDVELAGSSSGTRFGKRAGGGPRGAKGAADSSSDVYDDSDMLDERVPNELDRECQELPDRLNASSVSPSCGTCRDGDRGNFELLPSPSRLLDTQLSTPEDDGLEYAALEVAP